MKLSAVAGCVVLLSTTAVAQDFLVGYGNYPYDPICAQACVLALRPYILNCTDLELAKKPFDFLAPATPASCYASDPSFLTSVAWCFRSKCPDVAIAHLEGYWQISISGSRAIPPEWAYSVALDKVDPKPPVYRLTINDTKINQTSIAVETSWLSSFNGNTALYEEDVNESKFGIIIVVVAFGIPLALTWARVIPFVERIFDRIKPYIIYPSALGTYHIRPLPFKLGNAPTLGQTLYIVVFFVLNILLSAVDYTSLQPNVYFLTQHREVLNYICIRTGAFAFVLFPILFLFSSRNNILLYLSNWSYSTFYLLHRWVARLLLVHAVIHSITALLVYKAYDNTNWWYWGIVATVLSVVLTLGSGLYVRKTQYELFLISHVVLTVLVLVASWYHVIQWYALLGKTIARKNTLGYELWLYFAIAVWFFDRLARFGRVVIWGPHKAQVSAVGVDYVRVDIPGLRWGTEPGKHVYAYFPTLRPWTPWENHPFSVIPTILLHGPPRASTKPGSPADEEKQLATTHATPTVDTTAGITLFVKKSPGLTSYLKAGNDLLTFLDGPYTSSGSRRDILRCDRILIIAGGIGITGALPWAYSHVNAKLVWSVKETARDLVDAVDLSGVATKEVRVGSRFSMEDLIVDEGNAGWARVGVVVCGPGSLCDDVRAAVSAAGRRGGTVFELEIDAFSW
ncbi:hypothetical protein OQA88_5080 [Cercophora sp. LCS_1]